MKHLSIERFLNLLDIAPRLRQVLRNRTWEIAGLTLEQAVVLCRISRGEITISTLATSLSRATHTVTSTVNSLERTRLVSRRRDSAVDRRRIWISLTAAGK